MKITLSVIVADGMRGSHNMPLMPVPLNTGASDFDGPPIVSCAALDRRFTLRT